jgi:hypothetical protein
MGFHGTCLSSVWRKVAAPGPVGMFASDSACRKQTGDPVAVRRRAMVWRLDGAGTGGLCRAGLQHCGTQRERGHVPALNLQGSGVILAVVSSTPF